jgi:hypothetical protein
MKGIDVSLIFIIPKVIFYQYLHTDLSFGHNGIISDCWASEAKEKATELSRFFFSILAELCVFARNPPQFLSIIPLGRRHVIRTNEFVTT